MYFGRLPVLRDVGSGRNVSVPGFSPWRNTNALWDKFFKLQGSIHAGFPAQLFIHHTSVLGKVEWLSLRVNECKHNTRTGSVSRHFYKKKETYHSKLHLTYNILFFTSSSFLRDVGPINWDLVRNNIRKLNDLNSCLLLFDEKYVECQICSIIKTLLLIDRNHLVLSKLNLRTTFCNDVFSLLLKKRRLSQMGWDSFSESFFMYLKSLEFLNSITYYPICKLRRFYVYIKEQSVI